MSNLEKIVKSLKKNRKDAINYTVPDLWFLEDYSIEHKKLPNGEVMVNPYDFYRAVIEEYILKNKNKKIDYSNKSLSTIINKKSENGDWIKRSVLYSMMVRTSSSWDSDRDYELGTPNLNGLKETGTFVKTLALLPLLKRLGVDVLYLLPISKYSLKDKKGELGSPYSVESFTKLDPALKEDMTKDDTTLEEEFSALVEACHILGIRVTIDIIPRTNSVNSELVMEHPEWFYWIKASEKDKYRVPFVESVPNTTYPAFKWMKSVYESEDVLRHIKMFKKNPKDVDPKLFDSIEKDEPIRFLEEVKEKFDLAVAPAFSDQINDIQPPWTDVTYFRLYLDDPEDTKKYLKIKHNPYILCDTIKCNLYPGKKPNLELWKLLSSIIPYYQKNFGIDGARIDMGHALPKDLLTMLMSEAKKSDPDFSFIAEELNMENDKSAKENGYNAMIGNGFWALPRVKEGEFKKFISNAPYIAIPALACSETHDTRRTTYREGGEKLTRMLMVLDYFLPNCIPFVNSGEEVYEREPMNTGVDADQSDLEALYKEDPHYGKLALFDKYSFHYTMPRSHEIINHLKDVLKVREEWLDVITDKSLYTELNFYEYRNETVGLGYYNPKTKKCLVVIANGDMNNGFYANVSLESLRNKAQNSSTRGRVLYGTYEMPRDFYDFNMNGDLYCYMGSGEVKIIEF
ncbi:MAG: alpha-amylase [Gammaproteobacteria bacterium]|nr:alpha-amylase [Gammaproteobacteria bacterium]